MQNKSVRETVLSGLFIALGLVLPTFFHMFGAGSTFLPMHIPILIAGFVLSLPYAVAVGVLTPILSSVFTGMPPMFPVLPFMVFELAMYAAVSSIMYRKFKINIYISLISSMVIGRIVSALVVWVLATFFMAKLPSPFIFITGAVTQGVPGIIIQLVFIPAIIIVLAKNKLIQSEAV
ncbi:MAG: ECF transporter S component [Clostridia bacterium]|nr:ECF transporter S component [Clostridia bacterium]